MLQCWRQAFFRTRGTGLNRVYWLAAPLATVKPGLTCTFGKRRSLKLDLSKFAGVVTLGKLCSTRPTVRRYTEFEARPVVRLCSGVGHAIVLSHVPRDYRRPTSTLADTSCIVRTLVV